MAAHTAQQKEGDVTAFWANISDGSFSGSTAAKTWSLKPIIMYGVPGIIHLAAAGNPLCKNKGVKR